MNKYDERPFYVAMFVSRNKDNHNIEGFAQRTKSFLTQKNVFELIEKFNEFAERGVDGEFSRMYMSVNDRKIDKIKIDLQHYLLDHPKVNLTSIESLIASLSMKKGTANSRKFLFDFDNDSEREVSLFAKDVVEAIGEDKVRYRKTPNGFAVITEQGFDTRELLSKWKDVELKRDGMEFMYSQYKTKVVENEGKHGE